MRSLKFNVGDKIDRLTITKHLGKIQANVPHRKNSHFWECTCDCGKVCILETSMIGTNTKSCGCYRKEATSNRLRQGYKGISGTLWSSTLRGAKTRNLKVSITPKQAWSIFVKQKGKCALSGLPIELSTTYNKTWETASLDRIDSNKGYTLSNVQWVHVRINRMKMDLPEREFFQLCEAIIKFQGKQNG